MQRVGSSSSSVAIRQWLSGAFRGIIAVLSVACLSVACVAAPAATPTESVQLTRLRLGLGSPLTLLPNSVLWLAKDLGFYEREALDVQLQEVQGSPSVITALTTGDIDIGNFNPEDVIKLTATSSLDLRVIHSAGDTNFFMIVGRDSTASLLDLAGKSFAISRVGSFDHALTRKALTAAGVDPKDVQFVAVGAPAVRAQAVLAGQIDATTISLGTWVSIQHEPRLRVLMNAEAFRASSPTVSSVSTVTRKVLQEQPDALRRFTAAIVKTSRHLSTNRQDWVNAMVSRGVEVERKDLEFLWGQFGQAWAVNGRMNLAAYQQSADFLYETSEDFKQIRRIDITAWTDTQFVDAVLKSIGVDDRLDDPGRPIR
jgi:NitT/TauT family transport system substrate-binding protein